MTIHFICAGNTNRSRMAEAYLNSKQIPGVSVSSSGIYATRNESGLLSQYAKTVLTQAGIINFVSKYWVQTTKDLVEQNDVVVFMNQDHYDFCIHNLMATPKKYFIWSIGDVPFNPDGDDDTERKEKTSEDTSIYNQITKKVDSLIKELGFKIT